jgi:hypothetical protein
MPLHSIVTSVKEYYRSYIDFFSSACHYKKISGSIREYVLWIISVSLNFYFRYNQIREKRIAALQSVVDHRYGGIFGAKALLRSDVHNVWFYWLCT